uniref:Putative secreted protein n=1 Tax=Anopheles triannulatus TaxID=58253 RepID=A0A2M4B5B1_9DIPT
MKVVLVLMVLREYVGCSLGLCQLLMACGWGPMGSMLVFPGDLRKNYLLSSSRKGSFRPSYWIRSSMPCA